MNEIKSWQWLIIAAVLFMTLLCIVFAAGMTIKNIDASLAENQQPVVQAGVSNPNQPLPVLEPTRTPFLPFRLPTSISLPWRRPTPTPVSTLTPEPPPPEPPSYDNLSDTFVLDGVVTYPQWYTLDCESRTAVDWAAYFGITIDENVFLGSLPHSDNPDFGFVGRFDGAQGQLPPNSYGVHAQPVADLLNQFGVSARAGKGFSWEEIKAEISSGRPVIAWVIYNTVPGYPVQYQDSLGNLTTVAAFEHTVIVYGYSGNVVYIADNGRNYERTLQVFLASWSALENMAIVAGN